MNSLVALHNVLIVDSYSLSESVKPGKPISANLLPKKGQRCITIFLVVFLHEHEWIIVDITEKLDSRLDTPVVIIWLQEFMSEEETALESTHVTI